MFNEILEEMLKDDPELKEKYEKSKKDVAIAKRLCALGESYYEILEEIAEEQKVSFESVLFKAAKGFKSHLLNLYFERSKDQKNAADKLGKAFNEFYVKSMG